MDFFTLAKNRYSERRFSPRPIEQEKLDRILEAGLLAALQQAIDHGDMDRLAALRGSKRSL